MSEIFKGKNGPLLIAEIGGNHEGDFEYAKRLTSLAINSSVDFIKFQIYTGDALVSSHESPQRNAHFKKFELSKKQHVYLAEMVTEAGIGYTASVWDIESMDWIDKYMSLYKIGSGDLTAYPVLADTAERGKPIILSTGLSTEEEVLNAIKHIQSKKPFYSLKENLAILQCTSMYPISYSDANLSVMDRYRELTSLTVGYSDHTEGIKALQYAVALGAEVLEFHFTDTREGKVFRDHKVSLTPKDITTLVQEIQDIQDLMGSSEKKPVQIEIENGHVESFRRGVYPVRKIRKSEIIKREDLNVLRPNHGIDAREFDLIVGKTAKIDLEKGQALDWDYFR